MSHAHGIFSTMPRLAPPPPVRVVKSDEERSPFWWLRWVPTALLVSLLLYLGYVIGRVAIVPVLASFGLAYVLNPIVEIFERRGFSRIVAALLALLLVTGAVVLFVWFVVPDLWNESVAATDTIMKAFTEKNAQQAR